MSADQLFSNLRTRIRARQTNGLILPSSLTNTQRFQTVSEAVMAPLFRELTNVLVQEGFSAEFVLALDEDPPVVGISIEAPAIALCLSPSENPHCLTLVTHVGSTGQVVSRTISYIALAKGRLESIVERALEHALFPSQQPL